DRRPGLFGGSGQRNPDVGVLRLARTVDDAPHHSDPQLLRTGIARLPGTAPLAQVALNLLRHFLKERRRRAATSRTCRDLRREAPQSERLEDLLGNLHLLGAITAGARRERHADRVADTLLQQNR